MFDLKETLEQKVLVNSWNLFKLCVVVFKPLLLAQVCFPVSRDELKTAFVFYYL